MAISSKAKLGALYSSGSPLQLHMEYLLPMHLRSVWPQTLVLFVHCFALECLYHPHQMQLSPARISFWVFPNKIFLSLHQCSKELRYWSISESGFSDCGGWVSFKICACYPQVQRAYSGITSPLLTALLVTVTKRETRP